MIVKQIPTLTAALFLALFSYMQAADVRMLVYKTSTCGCCGKWVEHARANGFAVTVENVPSTAEYRKKHGVPDRLQSCHTAVVGGYTIEGHVPPAEIQRLLKERPKGKGLAVPGMPMGSPGMEGSRQDPYTVLLFDTAGGVSAFAKYPAR